MAITSNIFYVFLDYISTMFQYGLHFFKKYNGLQRIVLEIILLQTGTTRQYTTCTVCLNKYVCK